MVVLFFILLQYNFNARDWPLAAGLIVRDITEVNYNQEYKMEQTRECVVHIFNTRGREKYSDLFEKYNKKSQKLTLLNAQTVLSDGRILKPEDKAISDLGTVEGFLAPAYQDLRTRTISYSGVEPGATLEYKSIKSAKEPSEDRYISGIVMFQKNDPILHKKYRLKVPGDAGILYRSSGNVKIKEEIDGEYKIYEWSVDSMPRLKDEPFTIPFEEFCSRVIFTNYKDWNEVGQMLSKKFLQGINITKDIKEQAKLFNGSLKQILEQTLEFVCKNYRDVPLSIQEAGFKPLSSNEVYKNRYGNQLDKCALVLALLKAKGIGAYPAFVSFSPAQDLLPMPDYFYSVIVAVPEKEGFIFLDPRFPERGSTSFDISGILKEFNSGFPLSPDVIGRTAFILKPDNFIFALIPEYEEPIAISDITCEIQLDGSVNGTLNATLKGQSAARARSFLRHKKEKELVIALEMLLGSIKTGTILKNYELKGIDEPLQPVEIKIEFNSPSYLTKQGKDYRFEIPWTKFLFFELKGYFDIGTRTTPFSVFNAREVQCSITVKYPQGYNIYYIPENISSENDFASASNHYVTENQVVRINKKFAFKNADYRPEEYPLLKSVFDSFASSKQQFLIFKTE